MPDERTDAPGSSGGPDLARVESVLRDVFIAADGARLRDEDRKKARELQGLCAELGKAVGRRDGALVVDAACGKAYAALVYAALAGPSSRLRIVGIEREAKRAAAAREAAARLGLADRVEVREAEVADARAWPAAPDVVVALHACGDASDAIIDRAVAAAARKILLVPCCTSESTRAMASARAAADALGIPRHPEVLRRFLQAFVDAERTLRLEAAGYGVEVVAFVPPTVTPHNLLWRAVRVGEPRHAAAAAEALRRLMGR